MCPWLFTRMRKWEMVTGLTVGECRGERCTGITRTTTAGVAHRCRQASSMQTHNERNHRDAYQFISSLPVKYLSVCKPFDWNERISLNKSLLTSTLRMHQHNCYQRTDTHTHTLTRSSKSQFRETKSVGRFVSSAFRFLIRHLLFSLLHLLLSFFFGHLFDRKLVFQWNSMAYYGKLASKKSESRHATTATIACTHCLSSACFHRLISARKIDVRTF